MIRFSDHSWITALNPTTFLSALYLFIILSFLSTQPHLALALDTLSYFKPTPVSSPAVARTLTHLFVVGGATGSNPSSRISQFLSLDLNIAWSTTVPAWFKHADNPWSKLNSGLMEDLFPAAFSADEKILYAFHIPKSNSPVQWNSDYEIWTSLDNVKFENATWQGIGAVTDPRTGLIYLAGGYNDDSNLSNDPLFLAMDVFDPVSQSINRTHYSLPPNTFQAKYYYGNVWCKDRSSILYWGGHSVSDPSVLVDMVSEFKVDSQTWDVMPTTGLRPAMRSDHCMVSNEDGTKVLIYGGRLRNNTVTGDISILDTTTQTWTTGIPSSPRMYAACTVAGDQLLIWGGKAADNLPPIGELIIFNFVTKTWVSQYTPPAFYWTLKDPPPLNRTTALWPIDSKTGGSGSGLVPGPPRGVSVGGIVGGVVAGVVLIVVGVGVITARRRCQQQHGRGQGGDSSQDEKGGDGLFEAWANEQSGLAVLKRLARPRAAGESSRSGPKSMGQQSPPSSEDELQNTLQELRELEIQQQELEQKRQQLVLQQKKGIISYPLPPPAALSATAAGGVVQLRGPTEFLEPISKHHSPLNNPEYVSPLSSAWGHFADFGDAPDGGDAGEGVASDGKGGRRTVQDTTGMSAGLVDWASVLPPLHPHAVVSVSRRGLIGPNSRTMSI